jgi:hypothetical protein
MMVVFTKKGFGVPFDVYLLYCKILGIPTSEIKHGFQPNFLQVSVRGISYCTQITDEVIANIR